MQPQVRYDGVRLQDFESADGPKRVALPMSGWRHGCSPVRRHGLKRRAKLG
jgi:hypothetical protein